MKKKLIATLVAGAVLSTGLIGLTACGGGGLEKGEEVSKEDWAKAFTATIELKNFTAEAVSESSGTATGSVDTGTGSKVEVSVKTDSSSKTIQYIDIDGGKIYMTSEEAVKIEGANKALGEVLATSLHINDRDEKTSAAYYVVKEGEVIYSADNDNEENKWDADASGELEHELKYLLDYASYATEETGTAQSLSALYDAFTYSSGFYTATLWQHGYETKVTVSVKGGYVVGLQTEATIDMKANEYNPLDTKGTNKQTVKITKIGSTTVNASDDAKKAVEDYKAS